MSFLIENILKKEVKTVKREKGGVGIFGYSNKPIWPDLNDTQYSFEREKKSKYETKEKKRKYEFIDEGEKRNEEMNEPQITKQTNINGIKKLGGKKKRRILFTREQTYELEKVFQQQQYLTVHQREFLSRKVRLSSTQVKIWFQNHRYKLKKYFKDMEKEMSSTVRCDCTSCRKEYYSAPS